MSINKRNLLTTLAILVTSMSKANVVTEDEQNDFMRFAAKYNKNYISTEQMKERMENFRQNRGKVAKLNRENASTGVKFEMNDTGDMTPEEYTKMQGGRLPISDMSQKPSKEEIREKFEKRQKLDRPGRKLWDHSTASLNWAADGYVTPVKHQGWCGSCWAFTATTVQEAMQAIKTDSEPVRLSEQECLDCDTQSWGCLGGWCGYCWNFSEQNGSMAEADYPYEGEKGECRHQSQKTDKQIASKASSQGWLDGPDMISHALYWHGPVSIGVNADNDCWRFYSGGILSSANNCPTEIDHLAVVVGIDRTGDVPYWIVQNSFSEYWGDKGFIYLAVEEGLGVSGMNQYPMWMDVSLDYPVKPSCPNSDVDESKNPMGWGRCSSDSDCYGYRECSAYGICMGNDYCDDEQLPDLCAINEQANEMGSSRCFTSFECRGDRTCNMWGYCEGADNCI